MEQDGGEDMTPSEFTDCVTLYNRRITGDRESWQRKRLDGVHLRNVQGEAIRHSGAASSAARRIGPVTVGELLLLLPQGAGQGYLPPAAWRAAADPTGCFTLQPGDLLVPGDCTVVLTDSPAPLQNQCDRVGVISMVEWFDRGELSHWEVTAR
ncbi:MAG: hypothetical protein RR185_07285 [Angelakisella sp.]